MRRIAAYILGFAAMALCCSCSVKEDRGPCPGYLETGLDACKMLTGGVHLLGWDDKGKTLFDKRVDISQDKENREETAVPKGEVNYCAFFGIADRKNDLSGLRYMIPKGKDSDPLYSYTKTGLMMSGEYLWDNVVPHRQHCIMHILVDGLSSERLPDLMIRISSSTVGFSMADNSPIKGEFLVTGSPREDGTLSFTLLRQGFGDLRAEIFDNGKLAASFDLSAMLDAVSYDWTADDLVDFTMTFMVSSSDVGLVISPWTDGGSTDLRY